MPSLYVSYVLVGGSIMEKVCGQVNLRSIGINKAKQTCLL